MRKGVMFTIEAVYIVAAALLVIATLIGFLHASHAPDYGFVDSMKVIHDMGEDDTNAPPGGFSTTCTDRGHAAVYYMESVLGDPLTYDYGGTGMVEVCKK